MVRQVETVRDGHWSQPDVVGFRSCAESFCVPVLNHQKIYSRDLFSLRQNSVEQNCALPPFPLPGFTMSWRGGGAAQRIKYPTQKTVAAPFLQVFAGSPTVVIRYTIPRLYLAPCVNSEWKN